jgi:hypothetical protein
VGGSVSQEIDDVRQAEGAKDKNLTTVETIASEKEAIQVADPAAEQLDDEESEAGVPAADQAADKLDDGSQAHEETLAGEPQEMVLDQYFQLSLALIADSREEEDAAGEWLLALVRPAGSADVPVNESLARRAITKFIEYTDRR